jgi:DHA3 family tetracycline resistance protein-like MFS transporter
MSSEGFDRLNVAHFLQDFTVPPFGPLKPVVWFGAMSATATLLSLGAMELTRRALNLTRSVVVARALLVLQSLLMLAVIVFGLAGSFPMAVATFLVVKVLRQVSGPLEVTWLTQHTTPEVRATVISMSGQMDAFGQIAGGPIIGGIGLGRSVRAALITTGAVLAPALVLYARTLRKGYLTPVEVTAGVAEETAAAMVEAPGV